MPVINRSALCCNKTVSSFGPEVAARGRPEYCSEPVAEASIVIGLFAAIGSITSTKNSWEFVPPLPLTVTVAGVGPLTTFKYPPVLNIKEDAKMKAILVLDNSNVSNLRVMVNLTQRKLIKQVLSLLEEDKAREAFEILRTKAEVVDCLPRGKKAFGRPDLTLFEDML